MSGIDPFPLEVTTEGLDAAIAASNIGAQVDIQKIGLFDGGLLIKEIDIDTNSGATELGANTYHITFRDNTTEVYDCDRFELYDSNGILFAFYQRPTHIFQKSDVSRIVFAVDFLLTTIPPGSITITGNEFAYNPATFDDEGIVELADAVEMLQGDSLSKVPPVKVIFDWFVIRFNQLADAAGGLLRKTGGIMTGNITINRGLFGDAVITLISDTNNDDASASYVELVQDGGALAWRAGTKNGGQDFDIRQTAGSGGKLLFNGIQPYGPGNKPTPGDVGALSITGGVTTGNITINRGTAGDAILTLIADTDDNNENDNCYVEIVQDGGAVVWRAGTQGGFNDYEINQIVGDGGQLKFNGSKVYHSGNDGAGSGLDAQYLEGFSRSSSAVASTIAQRDSGSHLVANLFRSVFGVSGSTPPDAAQIFLRTNTGSDNYHRPYTAAAFVNWMKSISPFYHPGNDGAGSGVDAQYLEGSSKSQSVVANTIAQRNVSGDLYARLFRSNYQISSSTPPTSSQVLMRTSVSDDYLRPYAPDAFKAWMDNNNIVGYSSGGIEVNYQTGITTFMGSIAVNSFVNSNANVGAIVFPYSFTTLLGFSMHFAMTTYGAVGVTINASSLGVSGTGAIYAHDTGIATTRVGRIWYIAKGRV